MVEASRPKVYRSAAKLAGDDIAPANEGFWQIASNLFVAANGKLNPASDEIARLVDLSKGYRVIALRRLGLGARRLRPAV